MINIEKSALPYILSGVSLVGLSFVSFFKTINSVSRIYNCWAKPSEDSQKEEVYKEIFQACAWLGIFVVSTYFFSKVKNDFLEIPHNDFSPKQFDSHVLGIKLIKEDYNQKYTETDQLNNFCLASLRSSLAYKSILRGEKKTTFQIGSDPRFKTIRSALVIADEIKQNAQDLRNKIDQGRQKLEQEFAIFNSNLQDVPIAKGVGINFAQLCRTPFSILSNTTCSNSGEFQKYFNEYDQLKIKANIYEQEWLSPQKLEQCMDAHDYDFDPEMLLSGERIDKLEDSKRSFLGKVFHQINPF